MCSDELRRTLSRREWITLAASACALGQGMATRNVTATPRPKPSGIPFNASFTDVAAQSGLTAPVIYGGADRKDYIVETLGCGVAFFDYDNDGWLDILVLSGTLLDENPVGATNRLYKNNRDGTFTDVTKKAGLERTGWASSVTIGDYNNDGFEDVFISYWGRNVLYRNNGDGTFTDVTDKAGLIQPTKQWNSGATWIDYNRDGHLDLFVATYLDFDRDRIPKPGASAFCRFKDVPVNCGPRGLSPTHHKLYRNNGDGTFTDVSVESGISKLEGSFGLTAVSADFDNDGWPDIYVACDSTPSFLLRNAHDGTFRDEGLQRGAALNEDGRDQAGMGLAVGDYDLDGSLDVFKTHFMDDMSALYHNDGKGYFEDVSLRAGIGVETRYVSWGTLMCDFDNDGWPDILVVTGSVYPEVAAKFPQYPYRSPRLIFRNLRNGKFEEFIEEAGPGIAALHSSRGCACGDFDNDGDMDVLIMNMNEPPSLLRNDQTPAGNWIKVRLIGTKSNRSAIGSRVTAQYGAHRQVQEVAAQASFYSVNDRRLHFGLGKEKTVKLTVRWTNGGIEEFDAVASNHLIVIKEGAGIVERRQFPEKPPASR